MNPPPAISVLIPNYNYARYLPEAIESVLRQDFRDFELLISDDASTDTSAAVIQTYEKADPRIRVHRHQTNLGMVPHWNWCISQARGRYVHFVFGDDKLGPAHALGRLFGELEKQPTAVLASSARALIGEDSRVRKTLGYLQSGLHPLPWVLANSIHEYTNVIGEPSAVMIRKSAVGRMFNPAYKQAVDLELWLEIMTRGHLAYVDEPLCHFRVHGGQQSSVNRRSRAGRQELARLFYAHSKAVDWAGLGFSRRALLFRQLYEMRKTRREAPGADLPLAEVARDLGGWYWPLWLPCQLSRIARKLARRAPPQDPAPVAPRS